MSSMDKRKKKKGSFIPQVIHVDRKKHALNILRRFQEMQQQGIACDFNLLVDGRTIPVHRDILCGGSQYFRNILWHDSREYKRGEYEMLGVSYECVKLCIDFVYGREVNVNPDQYENLMFAAHTMRLKVLCKAVEESMMGHVDPKTLLQYKDAARFFSCPKLLRKCERYARIYFEDLSRADDFNEIDKDSLLALVKTKRSKMPEEDKLAVILRWVRYKTTRKADLKYLLEGLNLMKIPLSRLQYVSDAEELIKEDAECLQMLNESIRSYVESCPDDPNFEMKNFLIFPRNTDCLQLFDPRSQELQVMSAKKCEICVDYSATVFEDYLYIFGDDKSVYRLCYWDEVAKWEKLTEMKEKHGMFPPSAVVSRKIYLIGAFGQGYSSDAAERYHPDYKDWESLPNKPTKSDGAQLVTVNASIYCVGGWVGAKGTKDLFRYDTDEFEWDTSLSPMLEARAGHAVARWEATVIVAGGLNQWRRHKSVEQYDIGTDQWTALESMYLERASFNLVASDGVLFAVGGVGRKQAGNVMEKYQFKEQSWTLVKFSKEKAPKVYHSVAVDVDEI